jgi:hypothetical protein
MMINQYKRTDVFRCNYETHSKFENKVSVYHVLKKKKCWPTGCMYFKWKCLLLNKGKKCVRGYDYMGKKCDGCNYYEDIKVHNQPKLILDAAAEKLFWQELEDYEDWLESNLAKETPVLGFILSVKPHYKKTITDFQENISLAGYTLVFQNGYVGTTAFDDFFYANVPVRLQQSCKFAGGDQVEFIGTLFQDQGRVVFRKLRQVEFVEKTNNSVLSYSEALVAKNSATLLQTQHTKCLLCQFGLLVDVTELRNQNESTRRELFCLKGIREPEFCVERIKIN